MLNFKKTLTIFLTLILLLSTIPLVSLTASAETVKMGYIFETDVNIRKDATTSSGVVANVSKWNVAIIGTKNDTQSTKNTSTGKTYVWYKISYTSQSKTITGYVREDLIKVTEYTLDPEFKETLSAFPESYHNDLILLHAMYPKWQFIADEVSNSLSQAVALQDSEYTKLVETSYNSWRSMRNKCFNWSTGKFITTDGGRYGASREVISYYMDPRNFLNANDVYIYMMQSFDATTQTVAGVQQIIDGSFIEGKVADKNDTYYGKTYAEVIYYAGRKSGVNAYVLASTIIQEHGKSGTTLSKGTTYNNKTVYNFFNYGASGKTLSQIIANGAKYAYDEEWFTPSASIIGGATKYGKNYINSEQDHYQNTYFYKNYNVLTPDRTWHQYAQNVADSLSSSRGLQKTYSDLKNIALKFRIPVYTSLPSKVSALPAQNSNYNNYYFDEIKATGLSPAFNRYTYNYTLNVSDNMLVTLKLPQGATYAGDYTFPLTVGKNTVTLKIKSQTGYTNSYKITVNATKAATLTVTENSTDLVQESDGKYYYYVNGVKSTATGVVDYQGKKIYIRNGIFTGKSGIITFQGKKMYINKGYFTGVSEVVTIGDKTMYFNKGYFTGASGIITYEGQKMYINKGYWTGASGIITYQDKKWYIDEGYWTGATEVVTYQDKITYIDGGYFTGVSEVVTIGDKTMYFNKGYFTGASGVITFQGKKMYINKGYFTGASGFATYQNKKAYFDKGIFTGATELITHQEKTMYIENGFFTGVTGVFNYQDKVIYINHGYFTGASGVITYQDKKMYIDKGYFTGATEVITYKDKTMYIDGGYFTGVSEVATIGDKTMYFNKGYFTGASGIVTYNGKKMYINKGYFTGASGIVTYQNKKCYIDNGYWTGVSGIYTYKDKTVYINKGYFTGASGIITYRGKKMYINKGYFTGASGIVTHNGKKVYINEGIWDTSYTGKITIGTKTYNIKNGIVV
ncbi:MAG: hypothetical protein E7542_01910 [Ruminococcaceae bacterium]|nr:hypothetical protein [Oscillospiraceae bacterium]